MVADAQQALERRVELLEEDLGEARAGLDDAEAEVEELKDALSVSTAQMHSLHEQAHGSVPWTTCQVAPCRWLYDRVHGPAGRFWKV